MKNNTREAHEWCLRNRFSNTTEENKEVKNIQRLERVKHGGKTTYTVERIKSEREEQ